MSDARIARLALILFGVMTILCFGGPFLIGAVLRGGASPDLPPDRPIEWIVSVGGCSAVLILMVVLVVLHRMIMKEIPPKKAPVESRGDV